MLLTSETAKKFLADVAYYFRTRDTHGEDRAHWANVYNGEGCDKVADLLDAKDAEIERLAARVVQIKGQVAIADERNWRDVIAIIGFIADGRCDAPSTTPED